MVLLVRREPVGSLDYRELRLGIILRAMGLGHGLINSELEESISRKRKPNQV